MKLSFMEAIYAIDLDEFKEPELRTSALDKLEVIKDAISERCGDVEMQEPDGENEFFYEKWEEKYDELENLKDEFDNLFDSFEDLLFNGDEDIEEEIDLDWLEELTGDYNNWLDNVENYQFEYGGLKRFMVFF